MLFYCLDVVFWQPQQFSFPSKNNRTFCFYSVYCIFKCMLQLETWKIGLTQEFVNAGFRMAWDELFCVKNRYIMMWQSENGYSQKKWSSPDTWCTLDTSGTTSSTALVSSVRLSNTPDPRLNCYFTWGLVFFPKMLASTTLSSLTQ